MKIIAKSGVSKGQLQDRLRKGADYLELHLEESDIETAEKRAEIIINMLESKLKVKVLHAPFSVTCKLESLAAEYGSKIIELTFILADIIGKINEEEIHIVVHHELSLREMSAWGLYDIILEKLNYLLNKYPNVIIDLENETVIETKKKNITFKNNYSNQNVELCEKLRSDLCTNRVGVVLDTCHALSTIRILENLVSEGLYNELNLRKDYFHRYKDCLNIIHLSNARGYGRQKNHGTGFDTEEEIELLKEMLDYIKEINYDGIITLEVQEENYLDCKVFPKLYNQIQEILK